MKRTIGAVALLATVLLAAQSLAIAQAKPVAARSSTCSMQSCDQPCTPCPRPCTESCTPSCLTDQAAQETGAQES